MVSHVGQAEYEVPGVARVQVVVCDCKDAVSVFDLEFFDTPDYIPSVQLVPLSILSRFNVVVRKEIIWNSSLYNRLTSFIQFRDLISSSK